MQSSVLKRLHRYAKGSLHRIFQPRFNDFFQLKIQHVYTLESLPMDSQHQGICLQKTTATQLGWCPPRRLFNLVSIFHPHWTTNTTTTTSTHNKSWIEHPSSNLQHLGELSSHTVAPLRYRDYWWPRLSRFLVSSRDAMYVIYNATIHTVDSTVWIWHTLSYIVYASSWHHSNHYHYCVWYHVTLRLLPHHLQFPRKKLQKTV